MEIAAVIAVVMFGIIIVFQAGLALGAPWGRAAWGGQHAGALPTSLRAASGAAAVVVYPLMIAVVLASARLIGHDWLPGTGPVVMWVLTAFFGLGAVMNLASRSPAERIWSPVSLVIAICCGVIALAL